jgi:Iron-containing redox enzyme
VRPHSVSERLRRRLELVEPALSRASLRVLRHPDPEQLYPHYLATMHSISRAAVPVMEAARFSARERAGESAAALGSYLDEQIPEERGHADWILEDLEVIGLDRRFVLDQIPPPAAAALVGTQYYWIAHVDPVAILGYLAVMESNPPSLDAVDDLAARTGFPPPAFRSMRLHAQLDVHHRALLHEAINRIPLDDLQERLITTSALQTTEFLMEVVTGLVDRFEEAPGALAMASASAHEV